MQLEDISSLGSSLDMPPSPVRMEIWCCTIARWKQPCRDSRVRHYSMPDLTAPCEAQCHILLCIVVHENNCPGSVRILNRDDVELVGCVWTSIVPINDAVVDPTSADEARELTNEVVIVRLGVRAT